ncbi:MAG: metallophosphoesterase [Thermoguttaceae bacterium]|nr:metallophosphoesterase [Thermoguttaceae bacterium]MBQ7029806.1 metallophosphoesterase [Thermoguttaceae bacterium]MBQ7112273.1 metallophosphoesterase [Thermoguttaceae bacterium]
MKQRIIPFFRRPKNLAALLVALLGAAFFFRWQNDSIQVERFEYVSAKVPAAFDGFVVVCVADLHEKEFGPNNARLFAAIRAANPDVIAISGDLIVNPPLNVEFARRFVADAAKIAPVYYVSGNHEAIAPTQTEYLPFVKALEEAGAFALDGEKVELKRDAASIVIAGVADPLLELKADRRLTSEQVVAEKLRRALPDERFCLLISHRPELAELYAKHGVDLALTGHAHGGQIRLPFVGGLVAPNQGILPRYDAGAYRIGESTTIVSRGLGPSIFPTRLFNRPHLVVCELKTNNPTQTVVN